MDCLDNCDYYMMIDEEWYNAYSVPYYTDAQKSLYFDEHNTWRSIFFSPDEKVFEQYT